MKFIASSIFIILLLCQCNSYQDNKVVINRFDKELLFVIENYSDTDYMAFESDNLSMFRLYHSAILKGNNYNLDNKSAFEFISNIINKPEFNKLYKDVQLEFAEMSSEEIALTKCIGNYRKLFNETYFPDIYTHVPPFGYSIITTDSLISISLDNYMGTDYQGYKGLFYNYQLAKKTRSKIVPDIFKGWIYARYPNYAKTLVEGMIYEGAVLYSVENIIEDCNIEDIIGYNADISEWCKDNESKIWNAIIKSNHLYSNDKIIYSKYMNDAPFCSALGNDVPAEIGKWIGYRIVSNYIHEKGINSLKKIINGDIQVVEILKSYK